MTFRAVRLAVVAAAASVLVHDAAPAAEPARLYVTVDKAELVSLKAAPVTKISVTNPNIADVYVVNPTQILLSGRHTGTTSLLIFYQGGVESFDVVVQPSPMGNVRARLVPAASHTVEIQRAGKLSHQLFVPDEQRTWVELGGSKPEAPETPSK